MDAGSLKETAMGRALQTQLSRWHPAFTGAESVHDSLYALHGQRQRRMADLRDDLARARVAMGRGVIKCQPPSARAQS